MTRFPRLCAFLIVATFVSATALADEEEDLYHFPERAQQHREQAAQKKHKEEEARKKEQATKRSDPRDVLIRNLQHRVDALEQGTQLRESSDSDAIASVADLSGLRHGEQIAQLPDSGQPGMSVDTPPPPALQIAQAPPPPAAAGQFIVSPEAAQHALERALVQSGALLLRPGEIELVPSGLYQVTEFTRPDQLVLGAGGSVLVSSDVLRNTLVQSQTLARVGLPWEAQLEASLSYDFASSSNTTQVVGTNLARHATTVSGLGDASVSLIKQITHEGEWMPALFVSGTGNIGQMEDGLPLGSGFDWVRGAVLAVKRQDPLVFTAGFAYQKNFSSHGILPGDQFAPSVGLLFAVSPETSLQASQQIAFVGNTKFHGVLVPGSSQVQGIFQAGLLTILAPGVVLDFTAAVSETPDAPDLTLQVSVPIRLN